MSKYMCRGRASSGLSSRARADRMPFMKHRSAQTHAASGELALLKRLTAQLPSRSDVIAGPGDDCAIVRPAGPGRYDYLLKSDSLVQDVHFSMAAAPELVGRKALGRVLSDFAAMGGEPLWALVDLVAPPGLSFGRLERVYAGINSLARRFKVAIVGGDISAGRDLQLHVFGAGRLKKGGAVLRSGARAGDALFVTGSLGGSLAGRHLSFTPRLSEGQWLARGKWATAMIDVSDGLLRDLGHMLKASKAGARLDLGAVPVSPAARKDGARKALEHALGDGEDYELLFTVPGGKIKTFLAAWRRNFSLSCRQIGRITPSRGEVTGTDAAGKITWLGDAGYEHFLRGKVRGGRQK